MKIANNLQCWGLVAFISLFSFSELVLALDNYKEFHRDHWDFGISVDYFKSEANFPSSGGGSEGLAGGNSFSLLDSKFSTRYAPKNDWSMFGWGTVSNAESTDSLAVRSNSSLSELAVGFDFLMYSDFFQLVPEVIVSIPFEEVDPNSDTVLNSEGVFEVRSRLIAQKDFGDFDGYTWLGFNFRGGGRSFLMPWGIGAQFNLKNLRLGAELFGYQSVSEDTTDVSEALRASYITRANAGSMRFYGIKPSLIDTNFYAKWRVNKKWSFQTQGGFTLTGSNAAAGYHVGVAVGYSFDMVEGYVQPRPVAPVNNPVPEYRSNMYEGSGLSSETKVRRFREETNDGVNQKIFKAHPTKVQKQPEAVDFQVDLKKNKKKKKKKK